MYKPFEYYRPDTMSELYDLFKKPNYRILAGGTDLFVKMRENKNYPEILIDIKNIKNLKGIQEDKNFIYIGSVVTINEILKSDLIKKYFSIMLDAAKVMGCNEIRNKATLGGNICNASPGAEFGSTLLALDAICVVESLQGKKEIPLNKFYVSTGKVDLNQGEILKYFKIPKLYNNSKSIYFRHSRIKGMDLAGVNESIVIINFADFKKREIRIALGAVAPTPIRDYEIEKLLSRKFITKDLLNQAKKILFNKYNPRASSLRASPEYKKIIIGNFLEIALEKLIDFKK